jgi:hypothetical protein
MQYNTCDTCGACDGRAGMLIGKIGSDFQECLNCNKTRKTGNIVIHADLNRTTEELALTMSIIKGN